jgi:hypothetical protein
MDVERECLVDALVARGVNYLAGGRGMPSALTHAELIDALTQSEDARLRLALIPLFLAQPSLASLVPFAVARLAPLPALSLKQRYTAAACLQRYWRTRLSEFVADGSPLPDLFSQELGLPALDALHGRLALYQLAGRMSAASDGVDVWTSFNKTFEDFIRQLEVERPAA